MGLEYGPQLSRERRIIREIEPPRLHQPSPDDLEVVGYRREVSHEALGGLSRAVADHGYPSDRDLPVVEDRLVRGTEDALELIEVAHGGAKLA